jgi:hypothetical protein
MSAPQTTLPVSLPLDPRVLAGLDLEPRERGAIYNALDLCPLQRGCIEAALRLLDRDAYPEAGR